MQYQTNKIHQTKNVESYLSRDSQIDDILSEEDNNKLVIEEIQEISDDDSEQYLTIHINKSKNIEKHLSCAGPKDDLDSIDLNS